ncbi:MAG: N-acetyltransferase DgcN [Stappiaceae bacterium]
MEISPPYLLFFGDVPDKLAAKTGLGIVDWREDWCLGQYRLPGCEADSGLPDITPEQARQSGARTMVIGAVNAGGVLPDHWVDGIVAALEAGLHVASGLHSRLADNDRIRDAAQKSGCSLFDVRHSDKTFETGKGTKRSGKRLLTVGTDCSVGKKYTALALEAEMRTQGMNADFCATGQTGIFISGRGVSLDAVVADFISGAAEWLSPDAAEDHWHVVEGQGSLFHPSFAGVSLGLLHGSQPDVFVVCHEPTRTNMRGVANPLPTIQEVIDLTIACGRLTNPAIRCTGIAVNTAALSEADARAALENISAEYDLPAADPFRFGCANLVTHLKSLEAGS